MVTRADAARWARGLDEVVGRIAPRFGRAEPRRRAGAYLRGLLAPVARKNGWQPAEAAGDATPDGVQDFLSRVRWDAEAVRDGLRGCVAERLGDPGAVPVLDETGFLRRARNRPGCSGGTRARRGGSRTARSACSWATRAATAAR